MRRCRPPIFVKLETDRPGADLFPQWFRHACIAFAQQSDIDGQALDRLQHAMYRPWTGRHSRSERADCRTGSASDERRRAACECLVRLLWRYEMDMRVDRAGGEDITLTGDHVGSRARR